MVETHKAMIDRGKAEIVRQLRKGEKTFWELLRVQGTHIPSFIKSLQDLLEKNIISFDSLNKRFSLTHPSKPHFPSLTPCSQCSGKGLVLQSLFLNTWRDFQKITKDRPLPIAKYDQGTIAASDLALKAQLMHQRGDLEERTILLLGDDDLFSIFLALLGIAQHLLVLDIDARLLDYISTKATSHGLKIELKAYDAQNNLPAEIEESFHVFVSEPPESIRGLRLFLERGISSLKGEGGAGYFGLTTLESSWPKWLEIQRFLLSKRMVITDILRDFSWYPERESYWEEFYQGYHMLKEIPYEIGPPNTDWYRSTLLRVEMTEEINFEEEDLYMDEETWATPQPFSESSSSQ